MAGLIFPVGHFLVGRSGANGVFGVVSVTRVEGEKTGKPGDHSSSCVDIAFGNSLDFSKCR